VALITNVSSKLLCLLCYILNITISFSRIKEYIHVFEACLVFKCARFREVAEKYLKYPHKARVVPVVSFASCVTTLSIARINRVKWVDDRRMMNWNKTGRKLSWFN
jgi:hypothetical protein